MNEMIWKRIGDSNLGKIYNSNDIDPIAIWLGKFRFSELDPEKGDDEEYRLMFRDKACEVYDLAHRQPEWILKAKESPWNRLFDSEGDSHALAYTDWGDEEDDDE